MESAFEKLFYSSRLLTNITLELTNSCNLRCKHCYQTNRTKNEEKTCKLSFSVIEKLLDEITNQSVINISLTGGEVFTHPDIYKIISSIKKRNLNVNLLTNCTLINESNIKEIKQNVNLISTTCYGDSCETYENITQVFGSFNKYKNAISLLKTNNIRFIEKSIIMNGNYCDMESMCRNTAYTDNRIIVNKSDKYSLACSLSDEEHRRYYEYYYSEKPKELQSFIGREKPLKCRLWYNSLFVNYRGDVVPCLNLEDRQLVFGNVYDDNIMDIWNSEKSIVMIQKLSDLIEKSPCYFCEHGKYSQICPANNFYETGNISTPSSYECRLCKIKSEVINSHSNLKGINNYGKST